MGTTLTWSRGELQKRIIIVFLFGRCIYIEKKYIVSYTDIFQDRTENQKKSLLKNNRYNAPKKIFFSNILGTYLRAS